MCDCYHLHQGSAVKMWDHCLFVLTPVSCSDVGLHQAASSIYQLLLEHWPPRTYSAHDCRCNSEQKTRKILAHAVLTFYFEETKAKWNTKQGHKLRMRKMESISDFWWERENLRHGQFREEKSKWPGDTAEDCQASPSWWMSEGMNLKWLCVLRPLSQLLGWEHKSDSRTVCQDWGLLGWASWRRGRQRDGRCMCKAGIVVMDLGI